MCGISGVLDVSGRPVSPELIARNPRAQLLGDALRHISVGHGINALRAIGAIEDSQAIAAAMHCAYSNLDNGLSGP